MAWNEPGGPGNRDPWGGGGRGGGDQGPPDLDEVFRKLRNRFGGFFGGRGGGGGGGGGPRLGGSGIGLILVAALAIWAIAGIYIVDEGKRGVVLLFGDYQSTTRPGPHWHAPLIQSVERVDVENVRSVELGYTTDEALILTQDENIIDAQFTVQYQVSDARDYLFNVRSPDLTLRQAAESAIREVVGKSTMDFVLTGGRAEVAAQAENLLQKILDRYETGLVVTSLNMQNAQAPDQVQEAFADAVKAREDEERLKNEARAYANDAIPKARGRAARLIEEANAYKEQVIADAEGQTSRFLSLLQEYEKAPQVTRKRLYLDSLESVFSNSSKVVVDTEGENNLLYLPLDKLMDRRRMSVDDSGSSNSSGSSSGGSSSSSQAGSSLRDNLRRREVR